MMRFEWNALRVGDAVRLHPDGGALVAGVVAFVDVRRGSNAIGIRGAAVGDRVCWPSRMTVHSALGDNDALDPCLRCAALQNERS